MVIVMSPDATETQITRVIKYIEDRDFTADVSRGEERTVIGILEDPTPLRNLPVEALPGVEKIVSVGHPFKLVTRAFKPEDTIVDISHVPIGATNIVIIAGPCAVESEKQMRDTAQFVRKLGVTILRGGAFKPRTSPHTFRGLGEEGLRILAATKKETGLPVVTEVMSSEQIKLVSRYADMLQVGTRNMQNFQLLQEIGETSKPVLLKRGMSATIEEWLLAAEYILRSGNYNVVLCERGIRTFETYTRNTLDLSAIPLVKKISHLPIIVDPSHATGRRDLIIPMSRAAIAAGADGLLLEVHPNPEEALSDGSQSLSFSEFKELMNQITKIAKAVNRPLC